MEFSESYAARFSGIARLYGFEGARRLRDAHVCVVGIGGVGSWAVEALARAGIGQLTLIDLDDVCVSNVNRQIHALEGKIGQSKVGVMAERARAINPEVNVQTFQEFFTQSNASRFLETPYDFVFDAIDSLANKCLLIAGCRDRGIPVITAGGAGGRRDPLQIRLADVAQATHDRLIRKLRTTLRAEHGFPTDPQKIFGVPCVYTVEPAVFPQSDGSVCTTKDESVELKLTCEAGYGTATYITGAFGFVAAAHICKAIAEGLPRAK